MRAVIIDDDAVAIAVLRAQLARLGCRSVVGFTDAVAALASLQSLGGEVDLIFTDLQMPGMDGVQIIRNLAGVAFMGGLVFISSEDTRILAAARRLAEAYELRVLGSL